MIELQNLQFPIDQAIFAEVVRSIPSGWRTARLAASEGAAGGSSIAVRLESAGHADLAVPSDDLHQRVRELFQLNARFRTGLRGIRYEYVLQSDGRWSFAAGYDYRD